MNPVYDETAQMEIYRRLVRLYPSSFREQFEAEQLIVIGDILREGQGGMSSAGRWHVFRTILLDMIMSILHEHITRWRNDMKTSNILRTAGILALVAWILYFGLSLSRPLLGFPAKDPTTLLLGQSHSVLAGVLLELAVYLIPFLTFLAFLVPALKIQLGASAGETMVIRLQKLGKGETAFMLISLGITLAWWGLILLSRFGLG